MVGRPGQPGQRDFGGPRRRRPGVAGTGALRNRCGAPIGVEQRRPEARWWRWPGGARTRGLPALPGGAPGAQADAGEFGSFSFWKTGYSYDVPEDL